MQCGPAELVAGYAASEQGRTELGHDEATSGQAAAV
jgi:hypothetical protein